MWVLLLTTFGDLLILTILGVLLPIGISGAGVWANIWINGRKANSYKDDLKRNSDAQLAQLNEENSETIEDYKSVLSTTEDARSEEFKEIKTAFEFILKFFTEIQEISDEPTDSQETAKNLSNYYYSRQNTDFNSVLYQNIFLVPTTILEQERLCWKQVYSFAQNRLGYYSDQSKYPNHDKGQSEVEKGLASLKQLIRTKYN